MEIPIIVNISYRGQPLLSLCKPIDVDLEPYKQKQKPEQKVNVSYGISVSGVTELDGPKIVFLKANQRTQRVFDLETLIGQRIQRKKLEPHVQKMVLHALSNNWTVNQDDFICLMSKPPLFNLIKSFGLWKRSQDRL